MSTQIRVPDSIKVRLDELKLSDNESYGSVLDRVLSTDVDSSAPVSTKHGHNEYMLREELDDLIEKMSTSVDTSIPQSTEHKHPEYLTKPEIKNLVEIEITNQRSAAKY